MKKMEEEVIFSNAVLDTLNKIADGQRELCQILSDSIGCSNAWNKRYTLIQVVEENVRMIRDIMQLLHYTNDLLIQLNKSIQEQTVHLKIIDKKSIAKEGDSS